MRRIILSAFILGFAAAPAFAGTVDVTCREFAHAMAGEYMSGRLERAGDDAPLGNGDKVLIIAAGRSHYVPLEQKGVARSYLAERQLYNEIYNEEYWRCRFGSGNIHINVDPSTLTD